MKIVLRSAALVAISAAAFAQEARAAGAGAARARPRPGMGEVYFRSMRLKNFWPNPD